MSAVLDGSSNGRGGVSQAMMLRDALEDEIVNGVLKPGDRLDEAALRSLGFAEPAVARERIEGLLPSAPRRDGRTPAVSQRS